MFFDDKLKTPSPGAATLANEALAYRAAGNLVMARTLCFRSLALDRDCAEATVILIELLLEQKEIAFSLALAEESLAKWPEDAQFYTLTARAHTVAGNYDRADAICVDGISRFPDAAQIYIAWAQVSQAREDVAQAALRWKIMRREAPMASEGFKYGVEAAIQLKDWRNAGDICRQARLSRDWLHCLTFPDESSEALLGWALEPSTIFHYNETVRRLRVFLDCFPAHASGWLELAKVRMRQYRPRKAAAVCREAIARGILDAGIYDQLIDALLLQKNYKAALGEIRIAIAIHADRKDFVGAQIYKLLAHKLATEAAALYSGHENLFGDDSGAARLRLAIATGLAPEREAAHLAQFEKETRRSVKITLPLGQDAKFYLNRLARLAMSDKRAERRHYALMQTLALSRAGSCACSRPKNLCIYDWATGISYMADTIRHIPPEEIDIIFRWGGRDLELIRRLGLESYNIVDESHVDEYRYLISDANAHLKGGHKPGPEQTLICFWHSAMMPAAGNLDGVGAFIMPFENGALFESTHLTPPEGLLLKDVPNNRKCEIAFSGAFHAEPPATADKMGLRKRLEERHGVRIPENCPLVFVAEGPRANPAHLIRALNHISEYATVIFKPHLRPLGKLADRLSEAVIVVREGQLANNELRYAADFIMAECSGGTLISSLLRGLPLIAYYSRTTRTLGNKNAHLVPQNWLTNIPWQEEVYDLQYFRKNAPVAILKYMLDNNLLYDLLDTSRLRDAILNDSRRRDFASHLGRLTALFGRYLNEGAAACTAKLIRNFAKTGSFGADCRAVFFKN